MKKYIILTLGVLWSWLGFANESTLTEANALYKQEAYTESLEKYLLLEEEYLSGELCYNIGNVYFKLGENAKSILYYERAIKHGFRDEDLTYNLGLVRTQLIDKIDEIPEFFINEWIKSISNIMHFDAWAKLSLFVLLLAAISFIVFYIGKDVKLKRMFFTLSMVFGIIFMGTTLLAKKGYNLTVKDRSAIILTPIVTCKGSPDESGTDLFVIHEGLKVRVVDQVGQWYEIKLKNGNKGWVIVSDLEVI